MRPPQKLLELNHSWGFEIVANVKFREFEGLFFLQGLAFKVIFVVVGEKLNLLDFLGTLGVVNRQFCNVEVGWVVCRWTRDANFTKVACTLRHVALKGNIAVLKEQQSVKLRKRLRARRVDRAYNCLALLAS